MERHHAVADQHRRGDALRGVGDEHRAGGQLQLEIDRGQHEVARLEHARAVHGQTVQGVDLRQPVVGHDAPRRLAEFVGTGAGRPPDVEAPGGELSAWSAFGEDLDHQLVAVARQGPIQRVAIAFAHDGAGHAARHRGVEELAGRAGVAVHRDQRQPRRAIVGREGGLDALQQAGDEQFVGVWLGGLGKYGQGPQHQRRGQQAGPAHGAIRRQIRPRRYTFSAVGTSGGTGGAGGTGGTTGRLSTSTVRSSASRSP